MVFTDDFPITVVQSEKETKKAECFACRRRFLLRGIIMLRCHFAGL